MESKLSASIPFRSHTKENKSEVKNAKSITSQNELNEIVVKKSAMMSTSVPVIIPRIIPPLTNPKMTIQYGVGETRISSIVFWNFAI